jgi:hypothetical protein
MLAFRGTRPRIAASNYLQQQAFFLVVFFLATFFLATFFAAGAFLATFLAAFFLATITPPS